MFSTYIQSLSCLRWERSSFPRVEATEARVYKSIARCDGDASPLITYLVMIRNQIGGSAVSIFGLPQNTPIIIFVKMTWPKHRCVLDSIFI